jgi:hypothetical protein
MPAASFAWLDTLGRRGAVRVLGKRETMRRLIIAII